ncbi:MAG: hypothetical protein ABJG78_19615 [Cyclobacteriaceae bacterium]
MKKLVVVLAIALLVSGCTNEAKNENKNLSLKIDSLEKAIEANEYIVGLLELSSQYLDSIDDNRKWVTLNLESGVSEDDYIGRMKGLNEYVQKAEWTIGELEKTRSAYASQVNRLKKTMEQKDNEIRTLQLSVDQFQEEANLSNGVLSITEDQLRETQLSLEFARRELQSADVEIKGLMAKVRLNEAEIYYAQGEGMEAVAKKIIFAPKRKRRSLEDALYAYTTAHEMGYVPAKSKMEALEKKLEKD